VRKGREAEIIWHRKERDRTEKTFKTQACVTFAVEYCYGSSSFFCVSSWQQMELGS
jgi:hypothetical protein